jgi:hypothetical protein
MTAVAVRITIRVTIPFNPSDPALATETLVAITNMAMAVQPMPRITEDTVASVILAVMGITEQADGGCLEVALDGAGVGAN